MLFGADTPFWRPLVEVIVVAVMTWLATRISSLLENLKKVADDTHTLVNSNMGVQLRINADLAEWKALQTGKVEDRTAADLAKKLHQEHEDKQAAVDRKRGG